MTTDLRENAVAFAYVAILCITLALSWPALTGPFLFDDFPNLQHLSTLPPSLDWRSVAHYVSLFEGEPGRPLSMLSFLINDAGWPSDPWSFKYTNLMLHLLVGTLLFGFARTAGRLHTSSPTADLIALLTASAWLLHPIQLSTSMLVIQRMTQLSALFSVAGLWGYTALALRARSIPAALAAIAVLGLGSILSLLCKENGALTPLLALVLNATLLRSHIRQLSRAPRGVLQLGTSLPVVVFVLALSINWGALTDYGNRDFTMGDRLLTQARAICDYLFQIVLPNLRGSGIYHDDFPISRNLLQPPTTLPALFAVLAIAAAAFKLRRHHPIFSFGVAWYLVGHLLESTVFPLEMYFEHRNYLPMFGVLYCIASLAVTTTKWRPTVMSLAILWVAYAALLTAVQARTWGSTAALSTVWALEHPQSARATQQHADYLFRTGDVHTASSLLLDAYDRGVRGGDFPLQALIIACSTHERRQLIEINQHLKGLSSDKYASATLGAVRALRLHIQSRNCPDVIGERDWLELTATLLKNEDYRYGTPSAYLHVERAYYFRSRGNLNATMQELELAWAARPSPDLALLGAATLSSAGLKDQAKEWAARGLERRPRGLRGLLSKNEVTLRELIRLLEDDESQDEH